MLLIEMNKTQQQHNNINNKHLPSSNVHAKVTSLLQYTIFTNPSARAGYDTRSVFKRSLAGLNSELSFS